MNQKEFEKQEQEKESKYQAFLNRWNVYIESFMDCGFTKEQAEKLAQEFSKFKKI